MRNKFILISDQEDVCIELPVIDFLLVLAYGGGFCAVSTRFKLDMHALPFFSVIATVDFELIWILQTSHYLRVLLQSLTVLSLHRVKERFLVISLPE